MKKIINKPNSLAVDSFTYIWDSIDTNFSLRDTEFNNDNSGNLTTKFIDEYYKFADGDDHNGWSVWGIIVIFVMEYNAYYLAEYTRQYPYKDDIIWDGDSWVMEDVLEFSLIPEGTYNVPHNTPKQALKKQLCGTYDKLNGLKQIKS